MSYDQKLADCERELTTAGAERAAIDADRREKCRPYPFQDSTPLEIRDDSNHEKEKEQ